jgi:pimeloyl-ACP methyl ester carboxylesterase
MTDAGPVPPRGSGPVLFPRRTLIVAGAIGLVFIAGGFVATYLIQRFVTFPRPPATAWSPAAREANGGEQLWLDAAGDRVEAWYLPPLSARGPSPLLIYAHGNGELIDMRAGDFATLRAAGMGVLQVEYPGYGRSEGSPSDDSLTAAHVAAFDWASADPRVDARRILGYGRSLGGGAIAQVAARRPLAALVLESTFENFEEVVMAYGVPRHLLINQFDTRAVLANYDGPVLLLHGTQDRTFDASNARALAAVARRATLHLATCGHNDCPARWDLVLGFLAANGVCRQSPEVAHEHVDC